MQCNRAVWEHACMYMRVLVARTRSTVLAAWESLGRTVWLASTYDAPLIWMAVALSVPPCLGASFLKDGSGSHVHFM